MDNNDFDPNGRDNCSFDQEQDYLNYMAENGIFGVLLTDHLNINVGQFASKAGETSSPVVGLMAGGTIIPGVPVVTPLGLQVSMPEGETPESLATPGMIQVMLPAHQIEWLRDALTQVLESIADTGIDGVIEKAIEIAVRNSVPDAEAGLDQLEALANGEEI